MFIVVLVYILKLILLKFNRFFKIGNKNVVIILNKKIIEIDFVIFLLFVLIIGVVVVIVDLLYMDDFIFIKIDIFEGIFINLFIKYEIISEVEIVEIIINNDWLFILNIWKRFILNLSKIIVYCSIFLDVNWILFLKEFLCGKSVIIKFNKILNIGFFIIENFFLRN